MSFTYRDYKDWELAQGERYELIYGEAYAWRRRTRTIKRFSWS
jgi:hypothetical protein